MIGVDYAKTRGEFGRLAVKGDEAPTPQRVVELVFLFVKYAIWWLGCSITRATIAH